MTKNKIGRLIQICKKAGVLKEVKRTGWVLKGIRNVESVADHTWRMGFLIMLLAPKNLDLTKLHEMNIVHDLGEAGIGDIKWETGKKVLSSQKIKHKDEIRAIENIFDNHPGSKRCIRLLKEFNDQKTPEAKFLKQIDKLEMILQALDYEEKGYPAKSLDEFWENAEKYLKGKSLEPVFNELVKIRQQLQTK